MNRPFCSRRSLLQAAGVLAAEPFVPRILGQTPPTSPVAVAKCATYASAELTPTLDRIFDQLGGLGKLVKGKTVAIKVNLTGSPSYRLAYHKAEDSHYTHPAVIGATVHALARAGATRIRILESPWATADPLEEYMMAAGWQPRDILTAAPKVEFENTNYLGQAKKYSRFKVPTGGYIYPAYDLNHSYEDCDVFVSIAKMKEHETAGITLSMKNCFGITPCTIYGSGAGENEPSILPRGGRMIFHAGNRAPSKSAPQEIDPKSPRQAGWRVPRVVADLITARPIHLAIVEGIITMTGGEGPWNRPPLHVVRPGVIIAGLNPVTTDAVAMAAMGYDPMANRGAAPFQRCDNTLALAEANGVGTRDLKRIEVIGTPVEQVKFDFAAMRKVPERFS